VKKVAVFGNAGGGKSTLARRLAELTRLPLHPIDTIQFKAGGGEVPRDEYLKAHDTSVSPSDRGRGGIEAGASSAVTG
jgi:adenylate kinase family enzyme